MKNYFFLVFSLLTTLAFSQESEDKIIFLDSVHNETTKENHVFSRLIKDYHKNKKIYKVIEYYKDGKIKYEGFSEDKENRFKTGEATYYYPNGNKKEVVNVEKSNWTGPYQSWYENGNKKEDGEYVKYEKNSKKRAGKKVNNYWSSEGLQKVINGNGEYDENDEVKRKFYSSGQMQDGHKHGIWNGENRSLNYTFTDIYEDGEFKSGTSIDKDGIKRTYDELIIHSSPILGIGDFNIYVSKNVIQPLNPPKVNGRVFIEFKISLDGKIKHVKIVRGIHPLLDQEALRTISEYKGQWNPQIERGIETEGTFSVPIMFNYK